MATNTINESQALGPDSLIAADEWESRWRKISYPLLLDFRAQGVRAMAGFFGGVLPKGQGRVIEIGCGASAWLPYFSREFGYGIAGIDYSPTGVHIARKNLEVLGIDGQIVQGDVFDGTLLEPGTFDVVFSSGFIEHFPEVGPVMARLKSLLKPGGLMVTVVPNLQGLPGFLQRWLNRPVFDQHVVMDAEGLERRHLDVGLATVAGPVYLGGFDLWALNWDRFMPRMSPLLVRLTGKAIAVFNRAMNLGLRAVGAGDAWWVSQMIVVISRKGTVA